MFDINFVFTTEVIKIDILFKLKIERGAWRFVLYDGYNTNINETLAL